MRSGHGGPQTVQAVAQPGSLFVAAGTRAAAFDVSASPLLKSAADKTNTVLNDVQSVTTRSTTRLTKEASGTGWMGEGLSGGLGRLAPAR